MKSWLIGFVCIAVTTASVWWLWQRAQGEPKRLNIVVVSACSLRHDRLGVFNSTSKLTPKIDAWAKDAFIFDNALAERPWQNFAFEGSDIVSREFLAQQGYAPFRGYQQGHNFVIPQTQVTAGNEEWFWSEDAILKYQAALEGLKNALSKKRSRPIYLFTHLKYPHYPYLDTHNLSESELNTLSPKSQELLKRYRQNPLSYDAQLPAIAVLTNSFELLKEKFRVKGTVLSAAGVVSDLERARKWQATPGFKDDLNLVQELYDLKIKHFDDMAANVLNLFGDEELQKSTVVIFTGDHGEAFMEHGVLGHSVNLYDEMLRYPLIVKFPGQTRGARFDQQIHHSVVAELAKGLIEGQVTPNNFVSEANKRRADYVLSRNCQGDIRSVRYNNEWKFIKNLSSNHTELYDLKKDPAETRNVAKENPDLAWKFEEYMTDHQAEYSRTNGREKKTKVCLQTL